MIQLCVHTKPTPLATALMAGWAAVGGVLIVSMIFDAIDTIAAETV